ncbi:Os02g0310400, partial [Oryza sativa Japonica Group]
FLPHSILFSSNPHTTGIVEEACFDQIDEFNNIDLFRCRPPPPHNLRRPAGARHRGGASLVGEPHASRLRAPGDPVPAPCAGARRRRRRCEDPLHRGQDYRPPRHHHGEGAPPSCRPRQHGATGSGPARRPDGRHRRRWMLLERLNRAEEEEDAMEEPEEEKLEAMPQLASGMEDLSLLLRAFIALY